MLFGALIAIAGFILGVRLGLALGYRAERGRRIVVERRWLAELAGVLGAKPPELESVDAARARLLAEARGRLSDVGPAASPPQT